jgi:integrase/recombinase XerD
MVRRLVPDSRRWTANACRSECGVTGLERPDKRCAFWHAASTASFVIGRSYDIDWEHDHLRITRAKRREPQVFPLLPSPPHVVPHIYTVDELKRLVAVTDTLRTPLSPLLALTMQTLLLLLYGTGMRIGEALSLTLQDVDLENRVLTLRDAKFFKTRLVPIGPRLTMVLRDYLSPRCRLPLPDGADSAFLATRSGTRLDYRRVNKLFCRLRRRAGITRECTARYQPRIHDIRHTAAVHRVIAWYRAGMDVQQLLPQLATYLGHVKIDGTQRYLSMTPELLHEASLRFELYARPEVRDA